MAFVVIAMADRSGITFWKVQACCKEMDVDIELVRSSFFSSASANIARLHFSAIHRDFRPVFPSPYLDMDAFNHNLCFSDQMLSWQGSVPICCQLRGRRRRCCSI